DGTAQELIDHGTSVGARAAAHALTERGQKIASAPTVSDNQDGLAQAELPDITPLNVPDHPEVYRSSTHGYVDFSEDITSADLISAVKKAMTQPSWSSASQRLPWGRCRARSS